MKKKFTIPVIIILFAFISLILYTIFNDEEVADLIIKPKYGTFKVTVKSTGELQAKNSIEIKGPDNARAAGIWRMNISNLVEEGTRVTAGEFVAELDKSEISDRIKEVQLSIQKFESQYLQSKLDSSLQLSQARDELENLKFAVEEKQLLMDQSKYEPPAIQRQAEIDYEKSKRSLLQAQKNYSTKVKQSIARLSEVNADLSKEQQRYFNLMNVMQAFTIMAPSDGIVIYAKEWDGKKKIVGSSVSAWDPVVATLPDLSIMESVTYINEVDIQKLQAGQFVKIKLDANPKIKLTGKVVKVANIGEQKNSSSSKVFEVKIRVNEKDTSLLPSMTTSNEIFINTIENSLFIPLEAIHIYTDKKTEKVVNYVFKMSKGSTIKQEVLLGASNENEVIIKEGLDKDDRIYLTVPKNSEDMKIKYLK